MGCLNIFWICIFILYCATDADACKCRYVHPQTHYCTADFVLEGKITASSSGLPFLGIRYDVELGTKFKLTNYAQNVLMDPKNVQIYSKYLPCGITLPVPQAPMPPYQFYMTGKISQSTLKALITKCDFVKTGAGMTHSQLQGMQSQYEQGCECTIKSCKDIFTCNFFKTDDVCVVDRSVVPNCYDMHGICKRNAAGVCQWNTGYFELEACLVTRTRGPPVDDELL